MRRLFDIVVAEVRAIRTWIFEYRTVYTIIKQNTLLLSHLQLLQNEVMSLNKELIQLTEENRVLNIEVSSLTKEVSRLQVQLNNIK